MTGECAMRAGIDEQYSVARKNASQLGDDARRMDRLRCRGAVFDVLQTGLRTNIRQPRRARRKSCLQARSKLVGSFEQECEIGAAISNYAAALRMQADAREREIDADRRAGLKLQRPMHRVAFVQSGAEHDQEIERRVQQSHARMMRAGIAKDAERQRMVFGKDALRAQRRRDRNLPEFCELPQRRRRVGMFNARSRENCDFQRRFAVRRAS